MPSVIESVSWGKSAFHPTGNPKIKPNLRNRITECKILLALCLAICLMPLTKIFYFWSSHFSRWIKWKKKRLFWQQKLISSKNCWINVTEVCGLSRFCLLHPLQKFQSFCVVVQRVGYRTVTVVQIWHSALLLQALHKLMGYSSLSLLQEKCDSVNSRLNVTIGKLFFFLCGTSSKLEQEGSPSQRWSSNLDLQFSQMITLPSF